MTDEEWKERVAAKTAERDVARAEAMRFLTAYTKASEKLTQEQARLERVRRFIAAMRRTAKIADCKYHGDYELLADQLQAALGKHYGSAELVGIGGRRKRTRERDLAEEKLAKAREVVAGATTSTVPERDLSELLAELRAVLGDK